LTDAGQTYYRKAIEILELYETMRDEVLGLKGRLSGKLRITATETWGQVNLQPLIIEFSNAHPNVQIEAFFTDRVIDIYREDIHIAFRYMLPTNEPYLSRLIAPQSYYICASADYIVQHGLPKTLEELQTQNFICYLSISKTRTHFDVTFEGATRFAKKKPIFFIKNQAL
jgi:DNA-binding transcriptional LysR family regulator